MLRRPIQEIHINTSFEALGLRAELVRAVADEGYTQPTPVQAQAIPVILNGGDVLAGAQTGTGKTAGFALPLMQRLASDPAAKRKLRALILTPTRELAAQVEESFRTYGRHLRLSSTVVYGGVNINPQIQALKRGVDILVATPGRLLDHLRGRTVDLSGIEILVLDEADRMLDMGFIRDIRRVLQALPSRRQNLFFSATFSSEIRQLADSFLRSPTEVAVARDDATAQLIRQLVHPVDKARKRALLAYLIGSGDWHQVLVFTRTKHGANRLAEQLQKDGISASAIHGNKSQGARTRALAGFKEGSVRTLVATDIAARGLDIEELPHVVNYELPNVPEDYVHRIGRTGRAGVSGVAVSLVCEEEQVFLRDIERLLHTRIERQTVAGFEPGSPVPTAEQRSADSDVPRLAQRGRGNRTPGARRGVGTERKQNPTGGQRRNPAQPQDARRRPDTSQQQRPQRPAVNGQRNANPAGSRKARSSTNPTPALLGGPRSR